MMEEIKELNENVDCNRSMSLDNLPDEILVNIISMLLAKDVVRTSVLSKRWKHVWKYVSVLKFDQDRFSEKSIFINFVDNVLYFHDRSSLKELHLSCDLFPCTPRVVQRGNVFYWPNYRIDTWISTAIGRNIEVLKLCLRGSRLLPRYMLPHCLFNSQSLKTFHLEMRCGFKLPSCICLPSLEELNLSHVVFIDDGSAYHLLSSPALKRLSISLCEWDICSGSIDAPRLESLFIDDYKECQNSKYVYSDTEIAIVGPSLKFFSYVGNFYPGFGIRGSPHLLEAKIKFTPSYDDGRQANRLVELLMGLEHVKALTLSSECFEILARTGLLGCVSVFGNLTNLDLDLSGDWDHEAFVQILDKFPYLTTLNLIKARLLQSKGLRFVESVLDSMPSWFESHLK